MNGSREFVRTKKRAPTLDAAWDSLIQELQDFEHAVADSTTYRFLHAKKRSKAESPFSLMKPMKPATPASPAPHHRRSSAKKSTALPILTENSPTSDREIKFPSLTPTPLEAVVHSVRLSRVLPSEKSSRFPMSSFRERVASHRPTVRELSPEEVQRTNARIEENKSALWKFAPEKRLQLLREKALQGDFRIQVSRATREEIALSRRKRLEEDLTAKQRRFEWRMNAGMIMRGKKRWTGLLLSVAVLSAWFVRMTERRVTVTQTLHQRSQRVLAFFLVMSISCGKVALTVRRRRRDRAMVKLRLLRPFLVRWQRRNRGRKAELIADYLEMVESRDLMVRMVVVWKQRVSFI